MDRVDFLYNITIVTKRATYHFFAMLLTVLFLGLQTGAIAHDVKSDDVTHHQDCVLCHLTAGEETQIALPANVVSFENFVAVTTKTEYAETFIERNLPTPQGRAPPPRAPPATHI